MSTPVFINEFHYDNQDTDTGEFIELAGPAQTNLTGWSIVLYNSNDSAPYDTRLIAGTIDDGGNGFGAVSFYEGVITATSGLAAGLTSTDIGVSETGSEVKANRFSFAALAAQMRTSPGVRPALLDRLHQHQADLQHHDPNGADRHPRRPDEHDH